MSTPSKRYRAAAVKITTAKQYTVEEAVAIVKEAPTKFDASVELHARLGIDPKKSEQSIRGSVQLPHGTGRTKRVIAFVGANHEADAKAAGADIIGTAEVIQQIKTTGKIDFDVAVATPDMMKQLAPVARILGQKGLMPNPKTETVGPDVKKMVTALKQGKVNFKNDVTGNIHLAIGKVSFPADHIVANAQAVIEAIRKAKPATAKGTYIRSLTLATTMGPGVPLSANA
ncbi:MAG: 50S ribosomal protein L1 [uncultured bacterium]|nr:MAG: 50S ribosomal protein L1 [uncultured bacterium]